MEAESFAYWLQGYFEISGNSTLSEKQVEVIKNHLNMVFLHDIDPKINAVTDKNKLDKLHNPNSIMRC